jgi:hypothetical protein
VVEVPLLWGLERSDENSLWAVQERTVSAQKLDDGTWVSWMQAICGSCYDKRYPGRWPVAVRPEHRPSEQGQCCDCGQATSEGIYFREDPTTVRYPRVVSPNE